MKRSIEKTLVTGILITILCVLAIVLLSIWQYRRVQDISATIKHTNQVLFKTVEVLNASMQYELGAKNFLLTGDSIFLDSLDYINIQLKLSVDSLQLLTSDNKAQQERLALLRSYLERHRNLLDEAARVSSGNDFSAVSRMVFDESTFGYAHQIRIVANQIAAEEKDLLELRRKMNQRRASELQIALWGLIGAVCVLAVVVIKKVRVDLARDKEDKDRLALFNRELEDRVQEQMAEIQASEVKYRTLFYKSPLPKWIYDQDTLQFLEVNDAAVQHYGYTHEEFLQLTIRDIRPREDVDRLMADVATIRSNTEVYNDSNWRHIKKNGDIIYVELTAHSIQYEGRHARMVVVNDITDRRRAESLLRQLNEDLSKRAAELASSNAELERFAYIASHDLQEPLRMVSSFLQLLKKKYQNQLDEKAEQYIHYAVDGAERMKALILDLLEYSRVGTGKKNFEPVNMTEVMKEVADIFREKIVASRAQIDTGTMPTVMGDRVQLVQLLQNLVSNALKYHGPEPPVIRIGALELPDCWRFSIQDNGIGIEPLFFDKIFIIFQRLHNKSDYSGTGIGLAVCKKIVERHGGRIWVESAPQEGSTFYFTIIK